MPYLSIAEPRLRGRIESVLSWATVIGYRAGDNPARWRGNLDAVLAQPRKVSKITHFKAIPIDDVPSFMVALRKHKGPSARALEFLALTAARFGEVRGATWEEIDLKTKTWTIPAHRMKAGKEHRVPLSAQAIALLEDLPKFVDSRLVFPASNGKKLSDMAMITVMRRMNLEAVPHGFRSSFDDWCAERTAYPREIAEAVLAHVNADKVEASYLRSDVFEKRSRLIQEWATFCMMPRAPGAVVPLRCKKGA